MPKLAVSSLLGGLANEHRQRATDASPIRCMSGDEPPAFLYHGRLDPLVPTRQARRVFDALERKGVPPTLSFNRLGHFSN
jgi:dipeptidyl aminopeptidase/acylaminoacyl peptidase